MHQATIISPSREQIGRDIFRALHARDGENDFGRYILKRRRGSRQQGVVHPSLWATRCALPVKRGGDLPFHPPWPAFSYGT